MNNTAIPAGIIFFLCFCVLSSCVSFKNPSDTPVNAGAGTMKEQSASGYWVSQPSGNTLTVIGVSSPMVKRDSELEAAKEDAARKVSLFNGVQGTIETFSKSGSAGYFDFINQSNVNLVYDTNYDKYISQLKFDPDKDVYKSDNAVFVRFTYSTAVDDMQYTSVTDTNGNPGWVNYRNLPQISGYNVAVGFAQKQRWVKDTISKSVDAAVARMIEDMSTRVEASDLAQSGYGSSGTISTRSEGKLTDFVVLEFWVEPGTGNVYTLAAAKSAM